MSDDNDMNEFLGMAETNEGSKVEEATRALGFANSNSKSSEFIVELVTLLQLVEEAKLKYSFRDMLNLALNKCNIDCITGKPL